MQAKQRTNLPEARESHRAALPVGKCQDCRFIIYC